MGFLKNFFTNVYANEAPARPASGFSQLSDAELEAHLGVARYGDFELSDAVRPSYSLEVVPERRLPPRRVSRRREPGRSARPDGRRHAPAT